MDEDEEAVLLEEDGFLLDADDDLSLSIPEERREGFTANIEGYNFPDWN